MKHPRRYDQCSLASFPVAAACGRRDGAPRRLRRGPEKAGAPAEVRSAGAPCQPVGAGIGAGFAPAGRGLKVPEGGQKASSGSSIRSSVVASVVARSAASRGRTVWQKNCAAATLPV